MSRSVDFICLPVCFGKQEARQQAVQKTHTQALNLLITLLQIVLNMQKLRQPIKVSNIVFFVDKGLWNELQKMTIKYFYFEVSFLGSFHKTLCYKIRNNSNIQILSFGFPHYNLNFCLKLWSINLFRCGLFQFNWEQCVTAMLCFDMLSTQNISTHTKKQP